MHEDRRELLVERPVGDVYEFVADVMNDREWRRELRMVELVSGETGQVGATYREVVHWEGIPAVAIVTLVAADPYRYLRFEADASAEHITSAWTFTGEGPRTRIIVDSTLNISGPLAPIEPFAWGLLMRVADQALPSLVEHLESEAPSAPVGSG